MAETDADLDTLARADAARLKAFAEKVLAGLDDIEVLTNRTGLVMLPMRDTAQGTAFHLGEVLVSEAHIRAGDAQGYGMRRGIDLEAAMGMAVVDLAMTTGVMAGDCRAFCDAEAQRLRQTDDARLRKIAATRVEMETF